MAEHLGRDPSVVEMGEWLVPPRDKARQHQGHDAPRGEHERELRRDPTRTTDRLGEREHVGPLLVLARDQRGTPEDANQTRQELEVRGDRRKARRTVAETAPRGARSSAGWQDTRRARCRRTRMTPVSPSERGTRRLSRGRVSPPRAGMREPPPRHPLIPSPPRLADREARPPRGCACTRARARRA